MYGFMLFNYCFDLAKCLMSGNEPKLNKANISAFDSNFIHLRRADMDKNLIKSRNGNRFRKYYRFALSLSFSLVSSDKATIFKYLLPQIIN